ncbi:hypothetical protein L3Q82_002271 [Scortum barcoo]|uniref:Uncharacterized protein n=1 Tax=Scortum barcoo TaxID=214431 RepID=A0ACB8VXZ3_9TELE|nr:hypothetical protein L3Q82_002271 [Scortum barcoo]
MKFADDTTIVGLISDNDETHYREEIQHLTQWCSNNNLVLNTSKTKEVIVDYRRSRRTEHAPLLIHGEAVERVNNIKFLGIHITSDLTWSMNTAHLVKKAQQRLFFLRKLKRAGLSPQLLTNFYRATTESILCLSAAVWYGSCTAQDRKDLAQNSTGDCGKSSSRPGLNIRWPDPEEGPTYYRNNPTHPGNGLFVPLPSGKWRTEHAPLLIHGEAVERVNNIKFLGIHITSDLTWSMNTAHLVKKAQQRLFFLRKLKHAGLSALAEEEVTLKSAAGGAFL